MQVTALRCVDVVIVGEETIDQPAALREPTDASSARQEAIERKPRGLKLPDFDMGQDLSFFKVKANRT